MTEDPQRQAEILEELLPEAIRALFPGGENEPLAELPISQMRVVRLLWRSPCTSTEIAEALSISPPAVAQLLAKLEASELINKVSVEHDRRSKTVELSENGKCLMQARRSLRTQKAALILESIDAHDRAAVVGALRKLVDLTKP